MNRRLAAAWLVSAFVLPGCATLRPAPTPLEPAVLAAELRALPPGTLLLLGEQHDADDHQRLARLSTEQLAAQDRLAAVVLEMAERGTSTRGLPRDASEADARERLRWNTAGWPWERYGPVVMAAVRAGVPVWGGNLPRAAMRDAMRDVGLDTRISPAALQAQFHNIREGHCGLLPETQIPGMARIQVARDVALARTLTDVTDGSRLVLLLAGGQHVLRDRGAPVHLPPELNRRARVVLMVAGDGPHTGPGADRVWQTPATPPRDHCAELRQQLQRPGN